MTEKAAKYKDFKEGDWVEVTYIGRVRHEFDYSRSISGPANRHWVLQTLNGGSSIALENHTEASITATRKPLQQFDIVPVDEPEPPLGTLLADGRLTAVRDNVGWWTSYSSTAKNWEEIIGAGKKWKVVRFGD